VRACEIFWHVTTEYLAHRSWIRFIGAHALRV
jgi:hypothetical protein